MVALVRCAPGNFRLCGARVSVPLHRRCLPRENLPVQIRGVRRCFSTDQRFIAEPQSPEKPFYAKNVDPACWDHVVPFEARFLEALQLNKVAEPSEFQIEVSKIFHQIDLDGDGTIDRGELEHLLEHRIYPSCPPEVWAITPDQLVEKLGGTGHRVTQAEFLSAVKRIADTLDSRVWPLATSQFFSALMFAINQPLMPLLVKDLNIDMAQFGWMVALMPLVRIGLAVPSTTIANKYGRKPLTVEGQLVAAAGFGLSAFVAAPWHLAVSRLTIGAGTSFAGVGQQNMLGDIATGRTRSRVFAPGAMRASAAFAVGPAAGGWLADSCGVQATYIFVAMGMAAVSLRNRVILTETLRSSGKKTLPTQAEPACQSGVSQARAWARASRQFFRDPALCAVTFANIGFNTTAISSKFVLLPMLALDTWSLSASSLGFVMGAMSVVQFTTARPAAYIADVYGRKMALLPGLALNTVAMATAAAGISTEVAMPLVCGCWALGTSLVGSVPSALTLDAAGRCGMDQEETARALAISRVLSDVGMMFGSIASGVLLSSMDAPAAFGIQSGVLSVVTVTSAAALLRQRGL